MNEHKIFNVVMYFITVIAVWVAAVVFYFVCLKDLSSGDSLALLIIIGLGVFTVSALFYLLEVFTALEHRAVASVLFFIGLAIQVAGAIVLWVIFCSENYNSSFVTGTPDWVLSVCSVLPVIGLIMFDVVPKKASIFSALVPVISVLVAAGYCVACYFIAGNIDITWGSDAIAENSVYFLAPILIIAIVTVIWNIIRIVCKLIVMIGSS